jgi:hypothetical protein
MDAFLAVELERRALRHRSYVVAIESTNVPLLPATL